MRNTRRNRHVMLGYHFCTQEPIRSECATIGNANTGTLRDQTLSGEAPGDRSPLEAANDPELAQHKDSAIVPGGRGISSFRGNGNLCQTMT